MNLFHTSLLSLVLLLTSVAAHAQPINWANTQSEHKHLLTAHAGIEHAIVFGAGYNRKLHAGKFLLLVGGNYSFASGKTIFDDSKLKIGAQIGLLNWNALHVSARLHGIARTTKNDFVRMTGFGSEAALTAGIYKPKWFTGAEFGFDKSIVIHLKHGQAYKDNYAAAVDGWYEPDAGGNVYFGLVAGRTLGRNDITLRAGRMLTEQFKAMHLLPFYFELGYNLKF
jgi:hypothetical protein